ncbi:MAG: hypothetical protein ABW022_02395, partial [Actinoplanes sp.]
MAASVDGRPALAVRRLRAALRLTGAAAPETRGRMLVSLAWSESECGRVDLGFRLLDEAERLLPEAGRPVLFAQRALLLRRNGRNDLALPEFGRAIAALTERDHALDLVKALNNRSLLHLDAGQVGAARQDLTRAERIAQRHDMPVTALLLHVNLGCLDVVAGDLPAALGLFATSRRGYERMATGRLAGLAVENARALLAAGLFREADRDLAAAVDQARAQGQKHTWAAALQVRAEVALLAARPAAAAAWAGQARALFHSRGNHRRAALAALLALRAQQAAASSASAEPSALAEPSAPVAPPAPLVAATNGELTGGPAAGSGDVLGRGRRLA